MSQLTQFATPANQIDLAGDEQKNLAQQWSDSVNRWTQAAILGDPWGALNDRNRNFYYNPLTTDVVDKTRSKPITWPAFPNRILFFFPNATFLEQMGYAEGVHEDGTFGPPPNVDGKPWSPGGPRGWQDEYCEWIATRDANGKVTSMDFACENPDYWFSLWRVSPSRVLALYQQLVSSPAVKLEDLYLRDGKGNPVIDRATGLPAYNPINNWNNQPSAGVTGAVHLISPPNTIPAEIYLAAAATLLREQGGMPVTDRDALIECSKYGKAHRNSDPTIGSEVNKVIIGGGLVASLQDPVGLYIQTPDFSDYRLPSDPKLPADAKVSECWTIVRGVDRGAGDFDFILHARFQIPQRWKDAGVSFTVGDIKIGVRNIKYGAQLTQTFKIGLRGLALPTMLPAEKAQPCYVSWDKNPKPLPAVSQVLDLNLFQAKTTSVAVTLIEQGTNVPNIAVVANFATQRTSIAFTGGAGVTVAVTNFQNFPSQPPDPDSQVFTVTITAAKDAPLGDRGLQLTNADGSAGPPAPGMLSIVAPGTLPKPTAATSFQIDAGLAAKPSDQALAAAVARYVAHRHDAKRSP